MSVIVADTLRARVAGAAVTTTEGLNVGGALTATSFSGDGGNLTGVSGFATALGSSGFLNSVFQTPKSEGVAAGTSIQLSGEDQCGNIVFTRVQRIDVGTGATVTVSTGTTFIMDVLNICLLYTSPSPRDATLSRMPSSA